MIVEVSERAKAQFLENVQYNGMLAKCKTKIHQRLPWRMHDSLEPPRGVSSAEVVEKLQVEYKILITTRTLLNYQKAGEIDTPAIHGAGRGKGRSVIYPAGTVEKAADAWERRHPTRIREGK